MIEQQTLERCTNCDGMGVIIYDVPTNSIYKTSVRVQKICLNCGGRGYYAEKIKTFK